ncbi:hypothetical protein TWF730_008520 [Orbilia blumenaviensis]|uniref:Uncharacterized protein n=1 Tax=Orbilia blumenaviensis TaxID=1796055 RepID=A0AAV9V5S9_9PEZI
MEAPETQARKFAKQKAEEFKRLPTIGDYVRACHSDPEQVKAREAEAKNLRRAKEEIERAKGEWEEKFMRDFAGDWRA